MQKNTWNVVAVCHWTFLSNKLHSSSVYDRSIYALHLLIRMSQNDRNSLRSPRYGVVGPFGRTEIYWMLSDCGGAFCSWRAFNLSLKEMKEHISFQASKKEQKTQPFLASKKRIIPHFQKENRGWFQCFEKPSSCGKIQPHGPHGPHRILRMSRKQSNVWKLSSKHLRCPDVVSVGAEVWAFGWMFGLFLEKKIVWDSR